MAGSQQVTQASLPGEGLSEAARAKLYNYPATRTVIVCLPLKGGWASIPKAVSSGGCLMRPAASSMLFMYFHSRPSEMATFKCVCFCGCLLVPFVCLPQGRYCSWKMQSVAKGVRNRLGGPRQPWDFLSDAWAGKMVVPPAVRACWLDVWVRMRCGPPGYTWACD